MKYCSQVEHYTRDADGLCVNLRKPCVQVISTFLHLFLSNFARPNEIQIGSISTGASRTNFWGHFGSSSEPAGSINLPQSYFYQHIHLNRICQPVQWESFFSLHIIFFFSNEPLPMRS